MNEQVEQIIAETKSRKVSIYLVKVTRPPVLMKRVSGVIANDEANEIAQTVGRMQVGGLALSGISIQLVDPAYDEQISKIEAGDLRFHGIPVLYQINGV